MQRIRKLLGKKRLVIILMLVVLGIIAIGTSYSIFTRTDELTSIDFIAGNLYYEINSSDLVDNKLTIGPNSEKDITLTITSLNNIDSKYEVYYLVDGEDKNVEGVTISYISDSDNKTSGFINKNEVKDIDINIVNDTEKSHEIEFDCVGGLESNELVMNKGNSISEYVPVGELASTYIMNLASTNTNELRIDTHAATGQQNFDVTEYRYFGASPKNYVEFNNEMWRIIGVFDVDDGTGKVEKRVKIIRDESIGNYSWDTSTYNSGQGINEWSQADLKILLNDGDYYNRLNAYSTTGLTSESKVLVGNAKWYLGAHNNNEITSKNIYNYERSIASGKQCLQSSWCNDNIERKTNWVGQVGLMYPSDYGYAVNMTDCATTNLSSYNSSCASTNWLNRNESNEWTITPFFHSSDADIVFNVLSGSLRKEHAYYSLMVRPTVYLLPDVRIIDGTGESGTNAFKLSK